ncbi:MAG: MFS transporter, partial [Limnobacter sp.]|nr:MFS transporter [Limnobacter sp.]
MQLFWIGLFYAAYFGFVGLYSPFLGPYLKSVGHSLDVIAVSLGMMQVMRIFGPFIWGWVADKSEKQIVWMRLGSGLGLLFSVLAMLNSESAFWLILFIVFLNFSISGLVPLSDSYAMACCDGEAGRYGKVRLFGSVGFVFTVIGFGAWADWFGFSAYPLWVWIALLGTVVAALQFRYPNSDQEVKASHSQKSGGTQSRLLFATREIRLFWLASFFMIFAHGVFYAYFSLYLQEYEYSESIIGSLWAVGVILEIIFFATQGRLYGRFSHLNWLRLSFLACVVRFGLIALFPEYLWVL